VGVLLVGLEVLTIAVRVTDDPCVMLDAEAESVVEVPVVVVFTTTLTALEVDALKEPPPI
jgi:hypothetical protein